MRIGLYGMPTAGKSYIMDRINFLDVMEGSQLLHKYDPEFDIRDQIGRKKDRKYVASLCMERDDFIMDGHYAFGDELAFTAEDGYMYDCYIYLYLAPSILKKRMGFSEKNWKYLKYDLNEWQSREIKGLRDYCHNANKDFYVIDNPESGFDSEDVNRATDFIRDVKNGFSCINFAKCAVSKMNISEGADVTLIDGDKTLIEEDSSNVVFGYHTHLYDGNFYTGYQSWKQDKEFAFYKINFQDSLPVHRNKRLPDTFSGDTYIISSGNPKVWASISESVGVPAITGREISAETKFFIAKLLQEQGHHVIAYGDSLSDYYMLKQADVGYLVKKKDGTLSHSLAGVDVGGLKIV